MVLGSSPRCPGCRSPQNVATAVLHSLNPRLAAVVGIAIVAVRGAGIVPIRRRWDQMLTRIES